MANIIEFTTLTGIAFEVPADRVFDITEANSPLLDASRVFIQPDTMIKYNRASPVANLSTVTALSDIEGHPKNSVYADVTGSVTHNQQRKDTAQRAPHC